MTLLHFLGEDGEPVPVSAANPLPGAGGGTAVEPTWGAITGTLSDQTDLTTALAGKSATTHNHTGTYATAAQGAKADTAVQPASLAAVATSGAYSALTGKPVAAHVDPATGTVADIVNALIAAGLMAAA